MPKIFEREKLTNKFTLSQKFKVSPENIISVKWDIFDKFIMLQVTQLFTI